MRIARSPSPSPEDLQCLRKQTFSAIAPKRLAERCRIVLLSAKGKNHGQIAATRSTLAKVEARLIHVSDSDLLYFVRLFEVEPGSLLPELDPDEHLGTAVRRLLAREQTA